MRIKLLVLVVLVPVVAGALVSCSTTLSTPVPMDQRIQVVVEPLTGLPRDDEPVSETLEALTVRKLQDDYTHRLGKSGYPQKTVTELVTNLFSEFPAGLDVIGSEGVGRPILRMSGTAEQIVYGQPEVVEEYIDNTWMSDIWGLLPSGDDDTAAFVEYHVRLDDARSGETFKTIIVQGGYRAGASDREHIVGLANKVAAEALVYQLNKEIAPMLGRKAKSQTWEGNNIDEYPSAIRLSQPDGW